MGLAINTGMEPEVFDGYYRSTWRWNPDGGSQSDGVVVPCGLSIVVRAVPYAALCYVNQCRDPRNRILQSNAVSLYE